MSHENVELGLRTLDAFNRGDVDAFVAFLSPDVVWEENPELPGLRDVYHGRAEVREWMVAILEVFENLHVDVAELTELGDDRVDPGTAQRCATRRGGRRTVGSRREGGREAPDPHPHVRWR
jgi:ketosteroid isomerase-like protein